MNIQTMNGIIAALTALAKAHPLGTAIGAAVFASWAFSAFVGGMPSPNAKSAGIYVWLYKSFHLLAGNLDRFTAKLGKLPAQPIQATAAAGSAQPTSSDEAKK